MISYEAGQCWWKYKKSESTEERTCNDKEAHFYSVTRAGVAMQFKIFAWFCPKHKKAMEKAGYTVVLYPK